MSLPPRLTERQLADLGIITPRNVATSDRRHLEAFDRQQRLASIRSPRSAFGVGVHAGERAAAAAIASSSDEEDGWPRGTMTHSRTARLNLRPPPPLIRMEERNASQTECRGVGMPNCCRRLRSFFGTRETSRGQAADSTAPVATRNASDAVRRYRYRSPLRRDTASSGGDSSSVSSDVAEDDSSDDTSSTQSACDHHDVNDVAGGDCDGNEDGGGDAPPQQSGQLNRSTEARNQRCQSDAGASLASTASSSAALVFDASTYPDSVTAASTGFATAGDASSAGGAIAGQPVNVLQWSALIPMSTNTIASVIAFTAAGPPLFTLPDYASYILHGAVVAAATSIATFAGRAIALHQASPAGYLDAAPSVAREGDAAPSTNESPGGDQPQSSPSIWTPWE